MDEDNPDNNEISDIDDHTKLLEDLEDSHRLDLAVHLYLAHLLHRVNPAFPDRLWTSWPQPPEEAVDPVLKEYEDLLVPETFRDFQDGVERKVADFEPTKFQNTPIDFEARKFYFVRSKREAVLSIARRSKHNPKALMLNEIHASLQKVIYRKAGKLAGKGLKVNLDNTILSKGLAVKLANRLDKLFNELRNRGYGHSHIKSSWQEVLMASMLIPELNGVPDLKSYKRSYIQLNEMFLHRPYKYEYDDEQYGPGQAVPEFDVAEHLNSLQEWNVKATTSTALDLYRRREMDIKRKDAVIRGIYKLKLQARQLSHKEMDITGDFEPSSSVPEYREDIMKVFENKDSALQPKDFYYSRPKY